MELRRKGKKVLYHAISAYQLFEVMVHRKKCHKNDYAVLLLPDFIVSKYPDWKKIEEIGLFDEVHLFAYMLIPHDEETVLGDLEKQYHISLKYSLGEFSEIYVAGAHFYFSIYLIENRVPFVAFEDAAGMLGQGKRLRDNLQKTFPIHAKIVEQYDMFDCRNKFVKYVICNQRNKVHKKKKLFNLNKQFRLLKQEDKNQIYDFFEVGIKKIDVKNSIILLTQNFVGLGVMSSEEQQEIYTRLGKLLKGNKILIKVHPDDSIAYEDFFENVEFLPQKVPMELLLSVFRGKPKQIIMFSSTAGSGVYKKYNITNFSQKYNKNYSYENEFDSIMRILSLIENKKIMYRKGRKNI